MSLNFEWDVAKAVANLRKHGVAFDEASSAFADPLSRTIRDPLHSEGERRFVLLGRSSTGRLLVCTPSEALPFASSAPDPPPETSAGAMKKTIDDDLLPEYDFSRGVRGKYAARMAKGSNVVVLDRDVQKVFPDSASVNTALRALAQAVAAVKRPGGRKPPARKRTAAV